MVAEFMRTAHILLVSILTYKLIPAFGYGLWEQSTVAWSDASSQPQWSRLKLETH